MKSLSSAGVTLAILAAAAIGVVTTWMLMRQPQPQPVVVVFEEASGESQRATGMNPPTALASSRENMPRPINASTSSNPFPRAAAPSAVNARRETPDEPRPAASREEHSPQPANVVYQGVKAPVVQQTNQVVINDRVAPGTPQSSTGGGTIDDALSFALEAADPYVKKGFTIREDYWGGSLAVKSTKAIVHQLFKGNEYWFWMGTDTKRARIAVHIYDDEGTRAEVEDWAKPHVAAARVVPMKTGSYYLIVEVEESDQQRTTWALAYGFR